MLMGESHFSVSRSFSAAATRREMRRGSSNVQSQMCVSSSSFMDSPLPEHFPIAFFAGGRNDVAHDFSRALHASQARFLRGFAGRRDNFRHGLAKARDENGFLRLADALQHAETSRLEFRDGDFLHGASRRDRTMVNDYGQFERA